MNENCAVTDEALEDVNGGANVGVVVNGKKYYVAQPIGIARNFCFEYQIQSGDCLSVIADKFNVQKMGYAYNWQRLAAINGIQNASLIYAGYFIFIPNAGC